MSFSIPEDLEGFLHRLPKTQTHLHIEGAFDFEVLARACPDVFNNRLPSWDFDFRFPDFKTFDETLLGLVFAYLKRPVDYIEPARAFFEKNLRDNVRYLEVSFASAVLEFLDFDAWEVLECIDEAVPKGLEVRIFMGIHHNGFGKKVLPKLERALASPLLSGVDLHGDESIPVDKTAVGFFETARMAGKYVKAHAGEFEGPDFIYWVLDTLGAKRIEHGIRAVEDKRLLKRLKNDGITLDTCPISNIKLAPTADVKKHPCVELLDAGVPITLSTDDPLIFGNNIAEEYAVLHQTRVLSREEMCQIAKQGFQVALVEETKRQNWIAEVNEVETGG